MPTPCCPREVTYATGVCVVCVCVQAPASSSLGDLYAPWEGAEVSATEQPKPLREPSTYVWAARCCWWRCRQGPGSPTAGAALLYAPWTCQEAARPTGGSCPSPQPHLPGDAASASPSSELFLRTLPSTPAPIPAKR